MQFLSKRASGASRKQRIRGQMDLDSQELTECRIITSAKNALWEHYPSKQGLKRVCGDSVRDAVGSSESTIHQNKDWNRFRSSQKSRPDRKLWEHYPSKQGLKQKKGVCCRRPIYTLRALSIKTRIETWTCRWSSWIRCSLRALSIKTRIETSQNRVELRNGNFSESTIHQNKDWNLNAGHHSLPSLGLWEHYPSKQGLKLAVFIHHTPCRRSLRALSIKTRIETEELPWSHGYLGGSESTIHQNKDWNLLDQQTVLRQYQLWEHYPSKQGLKLI